MLEDYKEIWGINIRNQFLYFVPFLWFTLMNDIKIKFIYVSYEILNCNKI